MSLRDFKNLLIAITEGIPVYRDRSVEEEGKRVVWSVLKKSFEYADNSIYGRSFCVQVDYFTPDEYDTFPDAFEAALSNNRISVSNEFASLWDDETEEYRFCYTLEF